MSHEKRVEELEQKVAPKEPTYVRVTREIVRRNELTGELETVQTIVKEPVEI